MIDTSLVQLRRSTVLARAQQSSHQSQTRVRVGVASSLSSVQRDLITLGYDLGPTGADGKAGPKTSAAIRKFKGDHGLPVNDLNDDALRKAIDQAMASSSSSSLGTHAAAAPSSGGGLTLAVIGVGIIAAVWFFFRSIKP